MKRPEAGEAGLEARPRLAETASGGFGTRKRLISHFPRVCKLAPSPQAFSENTQRSLPLIALLLLLGLIRGGSQRAESEPRTDPGLGGGKKLGDGAYSCHPLVTNLPGLISGMLRTPPGDRDATARICSFN